MVCVKKLAKYYYNCSMPTREMCPIRIKYVEDTKLIIQIIINFSRQRLSYKILISFWILIYCNIKSIKLFAFLALFTFSKPNSKLLQWAINYASFFLFARNNFLCSRRNAASSTASLQYRVEYHSTIVRAIGPLSFCSNLRWRFKDKRRRKPVAEVRFSRGTLESEKIPGCFCADSPFGEQACIGV